jgi:hypothetical protein
MQNGQADKCLPAAGRFNNQEGTACPDKIGIVKFLIKIKHKSVLNLSVLKMEETVKILNLPFRTPNELFLSNLKTIWELNTTVKTKLCILTEIKQ